MISSTPTRLDANGNDTILDYREHIYLGFCNLRFILDVLFFSVYVLSALFSFHHVMCKIGECVLYSILQIKLPSVVFKQVVTSHSTWVSINEN